MNKVLSKIFAVVLAMTMLVTLVACNNNTNIPEKEALSARETKSWSVASPDNSIVITAGMDSVSNVYYTVKKGDITVLEKSALGLEIAEDDLSSLTFEKKANRRVEGSYTNISGKSTRVDYDAMELQLTFKSYKYTLDIYFRAYDDGYAVRYALDSKTNTSAKINSEKTEFSIPQGSSLWRQEYTPYVDFEVVDALGNENTETFAYERRTYDYIPASGIDNGDKIAFPMLYAPDINEDVYSLITESALIGSGFYGSIVEATSSEDDGGLKLQTVPTPAGSIEDDGYVNLPFTSPWRIGITGSLATVVESELVEKVYDDVEYWKPDNYDELSPEEQAIYNYDWVDPDVCAWSWIVYRANDQKNYAIHKAYLDKCVEMGWKYLLLDGSWSAEYKIYDDKPADSNSTGSFQEDGITTEGVPPNWDEFVAYANEVGVKLIVWGDAIRTFGNGDYNVLCDVLDKWKAMGVSGVKLDFWDGERQLRDGHQIPTHRCEDSANIEWYETVYQECAKRQLLVNCHGCNKPTGERRIYPNVINREGIYGAEMNANTASGTINQLFTRAVIGPSDFTPLVKPVKHRFTTGFMIALPVLFEGMTTVGDTLANLNYAPVQDLYSALPTVRDQTKFLCGAPDEYFCQAVRVGDDWFIAGVVDDPRKITFDLSFLPSGTFNGYLYEDGDLGADGKNTITKTAVSYTNGDTVEVNVGLKGGFVIHITKS
ncbi:MAG: glycoside hydrolase family 97 N-terminal domain-containing protein [Clostridia bacterium]|nr:glycoside hydrolase family 97 N-terminal domain-containing protein [Clostridia bacterium]